MVWGILEPLDDLWEGAKDTVSDTFKGPEIDVTNYTNTGQYDPNAFNGPGQAWVDNAINTQNDANAQAGAYRNQQAGWNDLGNQADQRYAGAWENQDLADQDAWARADQEGATQLAREAAMGMAPSVAENQMYAGLDQAAAQAQSQAAGARGLAALSTAQTNAQANMANMQNQTYNQAAQLRAGEMADARGMYGSLSNSMRGADQNRLQMGNQMSQFNAGDRNAYRASQYGQANQAGQLGLGYSQLGEQSGMRGSNTAAQNSQAQQDRQKFQYNAFTHGQESANNAQNDAANRKSQMAGGVLATAGSLAGQAAAAG